MLQSLYLVVAVTLRVVGVLLIVFSTYVTIQMLPALMVASAATGGQSSLAVNPFSFFGVIPPLFLGVALWFLSKPLARVVTSNL
jgi:hypothetical protein